MTLRGLLASPAVDLDAEIKVSVRDRYRNSEVCSLRSSRFIVHLTGSKPNELILIVALEQRRLFLDH